ncbi:envelope stress response membrane protein PspC [Shewanella surugensis]|uniref:Envelope stress response membrane protein PspC n=1 Tax=Shewanella surugensis TaxID=212020 RepID=A0ABT0L9A5_9GAMM|nr:envelope stress response membrane protein PspC [Shewanella surugensis]MCL1123927.1 envelope stress response membrane protein PspC [Shewanella surugensis]
MKDTKGKTLYRIPRSGKIAGVCAGVAEYFNVEVWLVRVVTASIFLLGGYGIVLIIYILLWIILDIKPVDVNADFEHQDVDIKNKVWRPGEPAQTVLRDVNAQFKALELRLQHMERHVTSDNFDLKNQINNL